MTTPIHRLASLPGYDDTTTDIYETPLPSNLSSDETSTTQHTTTSSRSDHSASTSATSSSASESEDSNSSRVRGGVSRRRLFPARARQKFGNVQISDSSGRRTDLSERVDGKRRGLRIRHVAQIPREDSRDVEGLEARIARLRREVEECRVEAGQELDFGGRDSGEANGEGELEGLGRMLASIETSDRERGRGVDTTAAASEIRPEDGGESDDKLLSRVADFDTRLTALEQSLGLSTLDSAMLEPVTMPILPSLTLLDRQLAALSSATSLTNLEAASARFRALKAEAENLSQLNHQIPRSRPSTAISETMTQRTPAFSAKIDNEDVPIAEFTPNDLTQLQALYALLPNLQSLSPTLPALLTRLRSLRTLHTTAASAASDLDDMEARQREMAKELESWKVGLERVEAVVKEAGEGNGRNGVFVEGWVRDLEGRVGKMGG